MQMQPSYPQHFGAPMGQPMGQPFQSPGMMMGGMTPPPQFAPQMGMISGMTPPPQMAMIGGMTPPPQFAPQMGMISGMTPPPQFAPMISGTTPPPQFAPYMGVPTSRSQPPMPQSMMMPPPSGAPSFPAPALLKSQAPPPPSKSQPPMATSSSHRIGQTAEQAGVGLYFKIDKMGRYFVEMVLPNTSASQTGVVKQGDILEGVQSQTVGGTTLGQLRNLILGPPGTYVNLSFLREMEVESFRFDVDLLRGDPNKTPKPQGEPLNRSEPPVQQPSAVTPADFSPLPKKTAAMAAPLQAQRAAPPPPQAQRAAPPPPTIQAEDQDGEFRKKYLAEQRLHMEADRELQQLRAENSILRNERERLSDELRMGGGSNQTMGDMVPREQLVDLENKVAYLEGELQRQGAGREELVKLEVHARTLEEELNWYKEKNQDMVPRTQMAEAESRLRSVEEQLSRQQANGGGAGSGGPSEQVQRLAAMALPAVVSALHQLSQDTGHASSATWALLRAEDYIAHMASTHFPLSVQDLVETLEPTRTQTEIHDACLSLAIISWDPEGRKIILFNHSAVPRLVEVLGRGVSEAGMLSGHSDGGGGAPDGSLTSLAARFAAMTLGNLSLDKPGRDAIQNSGMAVSRLVEAIRGGEEETASFSLLCCGNLFMLPEARSAFLRCRGSVDGLCAALASPYVMTIRFAVGAVRNLAADGPSRDAILSVMGAVRRLQDLKEHVQPKIRDHAASALYNLNINENSASAASMTMSMNSVGSRSSAVIAPSRPEYREYRDSTRDPSRNTYSSQPARNTAPQRGEDTWLSGSFRNLFSHS